MYVCICRAVTEKHIETAVKAGARHLRDLRTELGIIEDCGRCARCAKQCMDRSIEEAGARQERPLMLLHPQTAPLVQQAA